MPGLSAAMDAFYLGRDLRARMQQKSAGLQRHIKSALERTEKKKAIMLDSIRQSALAEQDRVFGDLLTATCTESAGAYPALRCRTTTRKAARRWIFPSPPG